MNYIKRNIEAQIGSAIERGKSILLLGPRQTGKTTLMRQLNSAMSISLIMPRVRLSYEKDPSLLADEVRAIADDASQLPLIIIDEIQKVPELMDVAQELIDEDIAQLVLTGSSARKLKRGNSVNLLPGRVLPMYMDPLTIDEIPSAHQNLDELLLYGSLPAVLNIPSLQEKEELLDAYVTIYLEEEIRAEAVVRNLASFARFLELAASESGNPSNYTKLSQVIGVAHSTIADYYQILEDCLVAERIEPLTKSKTRHKLSKTQKYILFDLGVRRLAAREGVRLPRETMGHLFEQFIMLEFVRMCRQRRNKIKVCYWRDPSGPEIDCVLDLKDRYIPIEIKYTERPDKNDARHLMTFLEEYQAETERAYIICRAPRKIKICENIYAIPWQEIEEII